MDGIASAIYDSCSPMIAPIVTLASVEGKVVIVVHIMPGSQRPYYLTAKGKESGIYIRVSGTTRPADAFLLMSRNILPQATIQCAVFKGKDRKYLLTGENIMEILWHNWMRHMNMFCVIFT